VVKANNIVHRSARGCDRRPLSGLLLTVLAGIASLLPLHRIACQELAPSTPTAISATILPDNDLRSPRATVSTFLSAMDPTDGSIEVDKAVKALDTSEIPELIRGERAEETAVKLYAALDYIAFTANKAPSSSAVDAVRIADIAGYGIYLERNGPNWRFSKVTVADIPFIFREIEGNLSKKDMRVLAGASNTWLTIRTYIPERLKNTTFLLEDWHWLVGLLALASLLLLHRLIVFLCRWAIVHVLSSRLGLPPTANLQPLSRPIAIVLVASALQLFLLTIDLPMHVYSTTVSWISTIRTVGLIVLGIYLVDIVGERLSNRASKTPSTIDDILYPLVQKTMWLLVILVGAAHILSVHGVNVSGLIAGLGLGGLAFALAAKDTVENIFGSIAILIDQPFRVGDAVNIGGVSGTVEQIGLRSTRLRTPENSLVSMPNSKVIAGHVDNLGTRPYLRTRFTLTLSYDTPTESVEAACAAIRELLRSHPQCKPDAILVHVHDLQASGLSVLVQFHLLTRDWATEQALKDRIFLAVLQLMQELGIRLSAAPNEIKLFRSEDHPAPSSKQISLDDGLAAARSVQVGWKRIG
jgi:MscS family membrane protein